MNHHTKFVSDLTAVIAAGKRKPLVRDWTTAIQAIEQRLAVVERRPELSLIVKEIEGRLAEVEHSSLPAFVQEPQAPVGSWRDAAAAIDSDPTEELFSRIEAIESQLAALLKREAPASRPPTRHEAISTVWRQARWRLLDIISGHILYEVCVLTLNDNAKAASLLKLLTDDTLAYAKEIVERREGSAIELRGSEWERTVRIVAARDRGIDAINSADDVQAAMEQALAAIGGI